MNEELFEKYMRDELSGAETAELARLLEEESTGKERFVAFAQQWHLFGDVAHQLQAASVAPAPETARRVRRFPAPAPSVWRRGLSWRLPALAAVVLIGLGVLITLQWDRLALPGGDLYGIATLVSASGSVGVQRAGAHRPAIEGQALARGDVVRTGSEDAATVIRYADGSVLELAQQSAVVLENGGDARSKSVTLQTGSLLADVAPQQAGLPMTLGTPHARIVVRGTSFRVWVDSATTRIWMFEGVVDVVNRTDGSGVPIAAGQVAAVGRRTDVTGRPPDDASGEPAGRARNGLIALYTFIERDGAIVRDVSGTGSPLNLRIEDVRAVDRLAHGGLRLREPTVVASDAPAEKIFRACRQRNELTVEAWIKPAVRSQTGPARIVSMSESRQARNFTLGQDNFIGRTVEDPGEPGLFSMRLRTTETDLNGMPTLQSRLGPAKLRLTHLVFTRDARGEATIYVDGKPLRRGAFPGVFADWDDGYRLMLGRELDGAWPWLGEYYLVAVYSRALSPEEISANLRAGIPKHHAKRVRPTARQTSLLHAPHSPAPLAVSSLRFSFSEF